jgi:hypothetical protein
MWDEGRAWLVPAQRIIDNGYNMTLSGLGLIEDRGRDRRARRAGGNSGLGRRQGGAHSGSDCRDAGTAGRRKWKMNDLLREVRELILSARKAVVHSVDLIQVLTNFEIGRRIVEHEQGGEERAEYGKALLKGLAASLTAQFGRGFSKRNLEYMRKFYLAYQDRLIAQLPAADNSQMPSGKLAPPQKSQTASGELADTGRLPQIWQTASAQFISPFKLSWSQIVFLISIENPDHYSEDVLLDSSTSEGTERHP